MADQVFNVKCGFFDAVNNDRRYSAADINQLYKRIINDGVFPDAENNPSEDLEVTTSSGMTILVNSGEGIFANRWFNNQTIIPIDVPSNTAANGRIDSVIVQVDATVSGRAGNIVYRTGEPSATPEPPTINSVTLVKEYRLANISVASGATEITASDITDLRGTTACPWVTGIISADSVPPESITTGKIANRAITAPKLADDSITTAAIVDYTVTAEKLALEAVTTERIAPGAVTEDKLTNGSVTTNKIADYAVTSSRLANGAVTSGKLAVGAVNSAKIDTGAVTNPKIAPGAVDTEQLANGAVDIDKVANALLITSTSAQVLYDDYHLPTTRFMNDSIERKVENPSKIVYFDTNGCICLTSTAFPVSSIYGTAYSMVVPSTITTIPDSILTFLPNVDTIYVDRSTIDLGTNVQTAVQNEDITIRYKGEYNLADLFANSQRQLNERIKALENG